LLDKKSGELQDSKFESVLDSYMQKNKSVLAQQIVQDLRIQMKQKNEEVPEKVQMKEVNGKKVESNLIN
jgi:hypothetical protein